LRCSRFFSVRRLEIVIEWARRLLTNWLPHTGRNRQVLKLIWKSYEVEERMTVVMS
jgi:hypothetical protein